MIKTARWGIAAGATIAVATTFSFMTHSATAVPTHDPVSIAQLSGGSPAGAPSIVALDSNRIVVGQNEGATSASVASVRAMTTAGVSLWSTNLEMIPGAPHRVVGVGVSGTDAVVTVVAEAADGKARTFVTRLAGSDGHVVVEGKELRSTSGGTFEAVAMGANFSRVIVVGNGNGKFGKPKTNGDDPVVFGLTSALDPVWMMPIAAKGDSRAVAAGYDVQTGVTAVIAEDLTKGGYSFNTVTPAGKKDVKKPLVGGPYYSVASASDHGFYAGGEGFLSRIDAKGIATSTASLGAGNAAKSLAVGLNGIGIAGTSTNGFAGVPAIGGGDGFFAATDWDGQLLWADVLGTSAADDTSGVTRVGISFAVAGTTRGSIDGTTAADPKGDAYVATFDENLPMAPSAPTNLAASGTAAGVTLRWDKSATNSGLAVTYKVAVYDSNAGKFLPKLERMLPETSGCATVCTVTWAKSMLPRNPVLRLVVTATSAAGDSPFAFVNFPS